MVPEIIEAQHNPMPTTTCTWGLLSVGLSLAVSDASVCLEQGKVGWTALSGEVTLLPAGCVTLDTSVALSGPLYLSCKMSLGQQLSRVLSAVLTQAELGCG